MLRSKNFSGALCKTLLNYFFFFFLGCSRRFKTRRHSSPQWPAPAYPGGILGCSKAKLDTLCCELMPGSPPIQTCQEYIHGEISAVYLFSQLFYPPQIKAVHDGTAKKEIVFMLRMNERFYNHCLAMTSQ